MLPPTTLPACIERRLPPAPRRHARDAGARRAALLAILSQDEAALSRYEAQNAYARSRSLDARARRIDQLV
jgi:hypothetical protein